ncbi:MAG: DNA topoisomerase IV subunit A [Proteobacteria bacterium]|nr:MAG: DNA topoisomerase IV subunit A [Pseudomonadota bacterium]
MTRLDAVMRRNFVDYASYAILDRAIPDLRDGLKPVQRRILHTLFEMHDGRYHKVANVIGETMKLHPHGDASIGDALVVLANKDFFVDRQGNFGSILTGHSAAAARYIECRLTPLALETMFNDALTEFVPSYDGRNREPVFLPAKLPVVLMLGAEGIAVGMATRILPHNLRELWEAQIAHLSGKPFTLHPDFPQGGKADVSDYDDGRGKVQARAILDSPDPKRIVIRAVPYGTTTESVVASIESAIQRGRVQIASIHDYTTDKVEIELELPRGVRADDVIPQLYAYTDCSVSVSSNIVVIKDRKPVEMTVSEILRELTAQLRERLRAELEWEQEQLTARKHWLTLERIFVEQKVYRGLETAETDDAVRERVWTGMRKFARQFVRPMSDDDVKRLLELRIRRISAFDLEQSKAEEAAIDVKLREVARKLANMKQTSIGYLKDLIAKYGDHYPRRTRLGSFQEIDKKAVARANLKLAYDKESGFFGSSVKGDGFPLAVSEFDVVLLVADDGSYRIVPPPDKLLIPGKLLHAAVFDPDRGAAFTVVYRDRQRFAFGKRVQIQGFIRGKEYLLIKDKAGKVDLLLPGDADGILHLKFAAMKRQRVHEATFDLAELETTGVAARGTRLAPKPVASVKLGEKPAPRRPSGKKGEQGALF